MQAPQQFEFGHVAEVNRLTRRALASNTIGIPINGDVRHLVLVEQSSNHLSDPAKSGDEHPR